MAHGIRIPDAAFTADEFPYESQEMTPFTKSVVARLEDIISQGLSDDLDFAVSTLALSHKVSAQEHRIAEMADGVSGCERCRQSTLALQQYMKRLMSGA